MDAVSQAAPAICGGITMKKYILIFLLTVFMLMMAGCSQSSDIIPLEELPADYSLEQAKADGCVTHENGDVTQGREVFESFYNTAKSGKADAVRLAFYYTLDDPSRYDSDYYESIKDDYPVLFVQDLTFDGKEYTIRWYEDGEEIVKTYSFLMKYEGQAESPEALYTSYVRYVLTDDDTVTWQELMYGMISSQFGDYIAFTSVCTDLIYE